MSAWRSRAVALVGVALAAHLLHAPDSGLRAQVRPIYSRGFAGLVQVLHRLKTTAGAMHTAAHPDDEDTALIARLARGDHARVAYLSLSRGEGGQNRLGLELFEALGVVRTEELLQARTLDGGEQLFTRAYDFGYTKTMAEASARWGEERILGDIVRAIRLYRPDVVISRFAGTAADGHGQHQLAGRLTPMAFDAAGDGSRFPEHAAEGLRPWQPRKLYVGEGFRPAADPVTLRLPTGVFSPLLGRTFFEIAMEGRSQHKSQEMGTVEYRGPQSSGLRLLVDRTSTSGARPKETSVFDGVDTSLAGIAPMSMPADHELRRGLASIAHAVDEALAQLTPAAPDRIVPPLARGLKTLRTLRRSLAAGAHDGWADVDFQLAIKETQFEDALIRAKGIVVDALADRETAAPGEAVGARVNVFIPLPDAVQVDQVTFDVPSGWSTSPAAADSGEDPPRPPWRNRETPSHAQAFTVRVADGDANRNGTSARTSFTTPYWLALPRDGDAFVWPETQHRNLPFAPPPVIARIAFTISDTPVVVTCPLEHRSADPVRGEIRRPFAVVPAMTVEFDEPLLLIPTAHRSRPSRVAVRVQAQTLDQARGTVRLTLPAGWRSDPVEAPFDLRDRGTRGAGVFTVTPPPDAAAGAHNIQATASLEGRSFETTMRVIDYPHIQTHRLYRPAATTARVLDLKVATVQVGYVMGSGDQVPDALRRMGVPVTLLSDDQLAAGDLSRYDTIVVGVRASESRPAFVASHGRLLQFAHDGGTLIVQYQQTDYVTRGLPPYPATMPSRVSDETAPVRILQPDHAVFTFPNRIDNSDFDEWVHERNLYAFATFDPRYVPLLETRDPGEPPQLGGQVLARLGKGYYIYTAYAWFRQLPAAVPGAYRLVANLISLPKAPGG